MTDYLRLTLPTEHRTDLHHFERAFVREHILEAYRAASEKPSHAAPILSRWLRTHRSLGSKDRRRVSDAVYGMIRHGRFLNYAGFKTDEALLRGWCQMQGGVRFEDLLAQNPVTDMAIALGVPDWMISDWITQIGEKNCAALVRSLSHRAPIQIRCSPNRCSRKELQDRLRAENIETTPIPDTLFGLTVTHRCNLQATQAYREGLLEIQDAASQRFCEALGLTKNERVLDYCAGAGGKALFLSALGAQIYIHEPRKKAVEEAHKRAKRCGLTITSDAPHNMDLVIVDAPCSGTGRLRREPALRWRYPQSEAELEWPTLQQQILFKAAKHVSPNGQLAYATCSMLSAENNPSLVGWKVKDQIQLWPHIDDCDGFGWTILQREPAH